ncbi:MAG: right-handed parallel beta-helix repeat-containing protein [bacterium]|nr:right-handed parallel beta-helix repeat-containing protein [bacterium]
MSWETALKTIQEGIDAASHGDTVIVAEGTYVENIHFHGKNIVLRSTDPLDPSVVAATIIDGNKAGSVVTFSGTEDEASTLSGFTICNGQAYRGGGICGGLKSYITHATIERNVIVGNVAQGEPQANGGGLALCDGPILNNTISQNVAKFGGGLSRCNGTIRGNSVKDNRASSIGGGLIWCDGMILNNIVVGNQGSGLGECDGVVENNTVYGNSYHSPGGGITCCDAVIRNCIIWGNKSSNGSQVAWENGSEYRPSRFIYCCVEEWTRGGEGNINRAPHFINPEGGDFHLRTWSPCIDAGDPESDFSVEPAPNGGRVNMGAYGNTPEAASRSFDTDSDGLPDAWEIHWFGDLLGNHAGDPEGDGVANIVEYWQGWDPTAPSPKIVRNLTKGTTYLAIQPALNDARDGEELVVYPGTYIENIAFPNRNVVLRSSDSTDADVVGSTVIDGNGAGSTVTFSGMENESCVLSGFTIRNGKARYGGGICGGTDSRRTHATIENSVIVGNTAKVLPSAFEANGGGLAFCDGIISKNRICDNVAEDYGGGLFQCDGTIANNIIAHNSALNASGLARCHGMIRNNIITGNSADSVGTMFDCNGTILNNTICGNASEGYPGALCVCQGTISNCIIWGNRGTSQLGSCSVPMYSCIQGWVGGGKGNVGYYPHFVDAQNADYHLKSWSPCIDAGDPTSAFFQEPQPNGGRINMGAYGNTSEATSKSPDTDSDQLPDAWEMEYFGDLSQGRDDDSDGDKVPNIEEYRRGSDPLAVPHWYVDGSVSASGDGKSWGTAFKKIQEGIDAASDHDTVIVGEGSYVENIRFNGKNIVLCSTDPLDADVVTSTIIDGSQSGAVVSFSGTEDDSCVLSGFTIRNGNAQSGGGIYGARARATICNNVVMENSAGEGGGLSLCNGAIQNNTICGNSAGDGGGLAWCDGTIQNNIIRDNSSKRGGGGLYRCAGTVQNNTIYGNSADYGAGLFSCWGVVRNCIVWVNRGRHLEMDSDASYCCIQGWTGGGTGNIGYYPCFVGASSGDFHLQNWSPCVDAGDPTSAFSQEPQPNGGRVNMGTYGNTPEATRTTADTDGDGLPDVWELQFFAELSEDKYGDPDRDGVSNVEEYRRGSDPARVPHSYVDASVPVSGDGTSWQSALKTIQEGIDKAMDGDVVVVGPGTYTENIEFKGKNIVLRGTDPLDASVVAGTLITGNGQGPVVTFWGFEGESCILSGFTIRGGKAEDGGGIYGGKGRYQTHATIENNVISGNSAEKWAGMGGGGIAYCDGIIRNNVLSGNVAGFGAGLLRCDGTIRNNTISRNSARDYGGGLCECNGTIQNNTISGNSADCGGASSRCNGTILNNVICGNSARSRGGGLYLSDATIRNNTIYGNSAVNSAGGLDYCHGTIENCIIWGNTGFGQLSDSSVPSYSCIQAWRGGGEGNIAEDPRFVDADGPDDDPGTFEDNNYRLSPDSPCIDAGNNEAHMWDELDPDGNSRIFHGVSSATVDMGAYEYPSLRPENVSFMISSAHGSPVPAVGSYVHAPGQVVPGGSVTSPAYEDGQHTRYRCTGYTGTGNAPSSVGTDRTSYPAFRIWWDSALTWNWVAQYRMMAMAGEGGTVRPPGETWYDEGESVTFSAHPAKRHRVAEWFMDGGPVQMGGIVFSLHDIQRPHKVVVTFKKIPSIIVRSNIAAPYELRRLPYAQAIAGTTQPTNNPKVFEQTRTDMEPGEWEIRWLPQHDAWPEEPVIEVGTLEDGGEIVFTKDYIANMPIAIQQLVIQGFNYATGTFTVRVQIQNTTGINGVTERTFTAPLWLVVKNVVFTVAGPDSQGSLWNADGITSARYPHSGDYQYLDVSHWAPLGPGETSPEAELEFYIRDRNPNFMPVIEVWADDPVRLIMPPISVETIAAAADGGILLRWRPSEGDVCIVEASDSLLGSWSPISDKISSSSGIIEWLDTPPPHFSRRFYRIRALPR